MSRMLRSRRLRRCIERVVATTCAGVGIAGACSRAPQSGGSLDPGAYTLPPLDAGNTVELDYDAQACTNPVVARGTDPLIDDFERGSAGDTDASTPADAAVSVSHDGRRVVWTIDSLDGDDAQPDSPTLSEITGGRGSSHAALHIALSTLDALDATFTGAPVSVRPALVPDSCYDAHVYSGITFWYRSSAYLAVAILTPAVVPTTYGGDCQHDCWIAPTALLPPTETWRLLALPWESFGPLEVERLSGIRFWSGYSDPSPLDFWLDDVAFMPGARSDAGIGGAAGAAGAAGASAAGASGASGAGGSVGGRAGAGGSAGSFGGGAPDASVAGAGG